MNDPNSTQCCIVGGGPAGIMLGYLLARAGVPVTVLEKHADFFRDFRGDTVHPSTLQVLYELGLLDEFLKIRHQQIKTVRGVFGDFVFRAADFSHLPTHCKFVALMPQWDFLNFLSGKAAEFPHFQLRMEHEAVDLVRDDGGIRGVQVKTPNGELTIRSQVVIGCDGRHSAIRQAALLEVIERGVPIDVLWFRISRRADDPQQLFGNINYGRALVLIDRGDYFQAGLIIQKGSFDEIKAAGIESFREIVRRIAPYLGDRTDELKVWEQIKLLSVQINRLRRWYRTGLLCIGDAAHAMSPAGGVGINLAIQDAVATARILSGPLQRGHISDADLAAVQRRRELPTLVTQQMQVFAHRRFAQIFKNTGPAKAPWQLRLAVQIPGIQRLTGRAIGIGARPEHVDNAATPRCKSARFSRVAVGLGVASIAFALALFRKAPQRHGVAG